MSHSLMLPSPEADARMFSLASLHAQSHKPSTVSNAATSWSPCGVTYATTAVNGRDECVPMHGGQDTLYVPHIFTDVTHSEDELLAIADDAEILRSGDGNKATHER
jgi:hypothetical protein